MPEYPEKILLLCTPEAVAALDEIARERATMDAKPNRSDAMRWLIAQYIERKKKSSKKSKQTA